MKFDHVAINVADIARSVVWYQEKLGAEILYQDASWAFLKTGDTKLALTLPQQHPAHIAFDIGDTASEEFMKGAKVHRDGSISKYTSDPDGNAIEWIHYPEGTKLG